MNVWIQLLACFFATILFAVLLNQPPRSLIFSGIIGTLGYGVFILLNQTTLAYFAATLVIGIACEITARMRKMASTLFITSALIPIVPGIGLYRTMLYIAQENFSMAGKVGAETILGICAIALAITISTIIFANFHKKPGREKRASTC